MYQNESLVAAINDYFRILHESDAEGAKRLFHQECRLFASDNSTLAINTLPAQDYLEVLRHRQAPRANGEKKFGEVITIDYTGPNTAFVKVLSAVQPRFFLDYLTFVKDTTGWRIVSKVYREVPAPCETPTHL